MSLRKHYRHTVTGLVSEIDPSVAEAMGDVLVEVEADAKPLIPLTEVVEKASSRSEAASKKESKDV